MSPLALNIILISLISVSFASYGRKCNVDLAFLIDVSRSISDSDFEKQKQFVLDIVKQLDVGPDSTNVAAVSYSNDVLRHFNFNQLNTKFEVMEALNKIRHAYGDATRTYAGLQYVNKMFTPENGDRPDVMNVVVVLTDGETNSGSDYKYHAGNAKKQTQIEASKLKSRPETFIFTVGVGDNIDKMELYGIASDPDYKFALFVDSFDKLGQDFIESILNKACTEITTALPRTTVTPIQDPPCMETVADIFFLVDQSTSIYNKTTFDKSLNFVYSAIDSFDIGPQNTQVGLIKFSTYPTMEFYLNDYYDKQSIAKRISQITFEGGDTYTDKALRMVRTDGLTADHGSRADKGVPQIVVVLTDGGSTDPYSTQSELQRFHAENYTTFAIGVKTNDLRMDELYAIASDYKNVFSVDSPDGLLGIKRALLTRVCTQWNNHAYLGMKRKP